MINLSCKTSFDNKMIAKFGQGEKGIRLNAPVKTQFNITLNSVSIQSRVINVRLGLTWASVGQGVTASMVSIDHAHPGRTIRRRQETP